MEISELAGYVATGVVALVVGFLLDRWRSQPRVVWYSPPHHSFVMQPAQGSPYSVNTGTVTVQNLGRVQATNVQVVFLVEPPNINIQPPTHYQTGTTPDGHFVVTIPSLGPQENVQVQVLYFDFVPTLQQVRSDAGLAKHVPVIIQQLFPRWVYVVGGVTMLVGGAVIGLTVIWLVVVAWERFPLLGD